MEELRDEDVHLQDVGDIVPFYLAQDVHEPLEAAVGGGDPDEVDLKKKELLR